jgi:hypothetical protein
MTTEGLTPTSPDAEAVAWARVGILAGLFACIAYPAAVFLPLPPIAQLVLGGGFGPALAIASVALARVLQTRRRAPSIEIAGLCNALGGALVTAMIVVQLAVRLSPVPIADPGLAHTLRLKIWDVVLGLDVAFDAFIGLGTVLFGLAMMRDARFGKIVGWTGVAVGGVLILGFNAWTFPVPPRDAGLIDPGPITGLWYLASVILMIRWLRRGAPVS